MKSSPSFIFILIFTALSCTDEGFDNTVTAESLKAAGMMCNKNPREMEWFRLLLAEIENNPGMLGDIYAIPLNGKTLFVHQPMIMSCFACVIYDCNGETIAPSSVDQQALLEGFTEQNKIYRAYH